MCSLWEAVSGVQGTPALSDLSGDDLLLLSGMSWNDETLTRFCPLCRSPLGEMVSSTDAPIYVCPLDEALFALNSSGLLIPVEL